MSWRAADAGAERDRHPVRFVLLVLVVVLVLVLVLDARGQRPPDPSTSDA
jgi:hypothetical protein